MNSTDIDDCLENLCNLLSVEDRKICKNRIFTNTSNNTNTYYQNISINKNSISIFPETSNEFLKQFNSISEINNRQNEEVKKLIQILLKQAISDTKIYEDKIPLFTYTL